MTTIRLREAAQSIGEEPERRGDERSGAARSGGSSPIERVGAPVAPDPEVSARHVRRRFTTAYKLEILRRADACTRHGELGALLRKEGLYSSHLVTWRQQRATGLTPKTRGRKAVPVDPAMKKLEQENRRLTTRPRPAPPRALEPVERQAVLDLLHTRCVDQAPAQMHAALLDEGTYLCSPRTMYRVLESAHEIKERRDQVRRPHYAAPELLATRPNEVWSWYITKLLGPAKWTYVYLYVILDIFSRYVVGWMLAPREHAALAERLIAETCDAQHSAGPTDDPRGSGRPDAQQARRVAVGRSRRHENAQPAARLQRQSVFRSPVQDPQILPAVSGPLRLDRRWPRILPVVLSLVQPRASSQRARFPGAGGRPLRPGRCGARAS